MPIFPPAFLAPGPFFLHKIATKQDDSEAHYKDEKNQGEIGTQKWTGWRLAVRDATGCNSPNSPTVHMNVPILVANRPSDTWASFISKAFSKNFSKKMLTNQKRKKHKKCHFLAIFWSQSRQPYTLALQFWSQINHLTCGHILFKKHF